MARNVINRSISFDPVVFGVMEQRRSKLRMDRSEYVKRCVMKDIAAGGDMVFSESDLAPLSHAEDPQSPTKNRRKK